MTPSRVPARLPRYRRRLLVAAAAAIVLDSSSKLVAASLLARSTPTLGWLSLGVVRNSGFAFGIGARVGGRFVLAVTAVAVVWVAILAWRRRLDHPVVAGLIVGGGLANVLDRAVDGNVVDLIRIAWWPWFNLADAFIVTGLGLLALGRTVANNAPAAPPNPSDGPGE